MLRSEPGWGSVKFVKLKGSCLSRCELLAQVSDVKLTCQPEDAGSELGSADDFLLLALTALGQESDFRGCSRSGPFGPLVRAEA